MRIGSMLHVYMVYVQKRMCELCTELSATLDVQKFEEEVRGLMSVLETILLYQSLTHLLSSPEYLEMLKGLGSRLGMKYKESRKLRVRLHNGVEIEVRSPYFLKASPKRGKPKRGPNGRGCHLGLDVLGIMGQATPGCVSFVTQLALLCPSFAIAKSVLEEQGIELDVKTIRRYCRVLGEAGMAYRGEVSLDGSEELSGKTVVVGIDGGRLRTRRKKRGRRKKELKRQGFHTEWKEPKLFTIYLIDPNGEVVKEFPPLHDATMGDHKQALALLEQYLTALPLEDAERIVFSGDGAPWIWSGVTELCQRMGLDDARIHQVLDYTHAKQQLHNILDHIAKGKRQKFKLDKLWLDLLWNGDMDALKEQIELHCPPSKLKTALNKLNSYFMQNLQRIQYQTFQNLHIPCGSGAVESAIRRVINLRLKAPGTFWKIDMAEVFLFLRSQLISGRWLICLRNITRRYARLASHYILPTSINHWSFKYIILYA